MMQVQGLQLASAGAPAVEPLTVADLKKHLRVDGVDEDGYLGTLIIAARELAEIFTRRAFVTQTWDLYLDCFPTDGEIRLPRPPLQTVSFVKYTDLGGTLQTLDPSTYIVDTASEPGRIALAYLKFWPTFRQVANSILVEFKAGYGDDATKVPARVVQAMKLTIGSWYANRESVGPNNLAQLPDSAQALLWSLRTGL